jgi:hypothetical protein
MKRLLIPLLALAILGAGCSSAPTTTSTDNASTSTTTTTTPPASTDTSGSTTTTQNASGSLTPATTDATWQTYTNVSLGFSFKYPTKGTYAPQWTVKFYKDTDTAISGGCLAASGAQANPSSMPMVGSQMFCHTSASEGAAGSTYFTDNYATAIGHTVVVIAFTKRVTNSGLIPNCSAKFSAVSTACVPFDLTAYEAALDGIVGTFTLTAK